MAIRYSPSELLKLTGQKHPDGFSYDEINTFYKGSMTGLILVGAIGINHKEQRVVDIAVHPDYRQMGIGRLLVKMSDCTIAYTVDLEADKFWEAIGWEHVGDTLDKDTDVKVWIHPDKHNEGLQDAIDEDVSL